ncbi:hypothetical protein ABPG72_017972 [Tetrahymena utriculariae]
MNQENNQRRNNQSERKQDMNPSNSYIRRGKYAKNLRKICKYFEKGEQKFGSKYRRRHTIIITVLSNSKLQIPRISNKYKIKYGRQYKVDKEKNCKIHMPHDEYVDEKHKSYKQIPVMVNIYKILIYICNSDHQKICNKNPMERDIKAVWQNHKGSTSPPTIGKN